MSTLSIYACGGAGINLTKDFVNLPQEPKGFFPKTKKFALDTSDSNIRELPDDITPFLVPGLRGAGKKRQQAFQGVNDHIADILNNHKPSDFNLAIFSASGGSGSVLGPLVVSELLRRGAPTLCVVVGSTSSAIETDNTIKTLQTLQAMCGKNTAGKPIMMVYQENDAVFGNKEEGYRASRPQVDSRVEEIVRTLGMLLCGSHHGMDYTDLVNFLDYSRNFGNIPPQLMEILPFRQELGGRPEWQSEVLDKKFEGSVVGVASTLKSDGDEIPSLSQPYTADGYYDEKVWASKQPPNYHFVTTASRLERIFGSLGTVAKEYDNAKAKLESAQVAGRAENADEDSGMVF